MVEQRTNNVNQDLDFEDAVDERSNIVEDERSNSIFNGMRELDQIDLIYIARALVSVGVLESVSSAKEIDPERTSQRSSLIVQSIVDEISPENQDLRNVILSIGGLEFGTKIQHKIGEIYSGKDFAECIIMSMQCREVWREIFVSSLQSISSAFSAIDGDKDIVASITAKGAIPSLQSEIIRNLNNIEQFSTQYTEFINVASNFCSIHTCDEKRELLKSFLNCQGFFINLDTIHNAQNSTQDNTVVDKVKDLIAFLLTDAIKFIEEEALINQTSVAEQWKITLENIINAVSSSYSNVDIFTACAVQFLTQNPLLNYFR